MPKLAIAETNWQMPKQIAPLVIPKDFSNENGIETEVPLIDTAEKKLNKKKKNWLLATK